MEWLSGLSVLLPGAAQGVTVTLTGHPFDTVKTRMQSGMYSSTMGCIRNTIQEEGVAALYRGMSVPMISHVVKRSYQFPIFHYLHDNYGLNPYAAGIISGSSGVILGNPLQVIKVNTQSTKRGQYKNSLDFMSRHYRTAGLRGFYRGLKINWVKDMVFGSVFMGNYTYMKKYLGEPHHSKNFLAGGVAHMITWGVFIPIDYVKTQVQTGKSKTITHAVRDIAKGGNYLRLWRGVIPALVRIFPVSGAGMTIYEIVRSKINRAQ